MENNNRQEQTSTALGRGAQGQRKPTMRFSTITAVPDQGLECEIHFANNVSKNTWRSNTCRSAIPSPTPMYFTGT